MSLTGGVSVDISSLNHLVEAATALAKLTAARPPAGSFASSAAKNVPQLVVSDEEESVRKPKKESSSNPKREIFPQRLMAILADSSLSEVISWLPHGRSFVIIRPDVLTEQVLPKYLPPVDARSGTKYPSFTRKLNRWGFRQATRGPDTGAFHHPLFRRDQPELCLEMVCQRSRDRKSESKHLKKGSPQKKSAKNTPKVSPLTKASLKAMDASSSAPQVTNLQSFTAPSVTDDSRSDASSGESSIASSRFDSTIKTVISSDKTFVASSLQKRDQMERVRVAKSLLYQSFMKAWQEQS